MHVFVDPDTLGADGDVLLPDGLHESNSIPEPLPEAAQYSQ